MPELPEVETIVRDLNNSALEGRRILKTQIFWPRTLATPPLQRFAAQIMAARITGISRRAKFIVVELESKACRPAWLLIHLRMTGRLDLFPSSAPMDPYVRAALSLDDGRDLRFKDIRKFGRWYFYGKKPPQFSALGPEPLSRDFTLDVFRNRIGSRARRLKPLLLDQSVIAGLGNIYVDEALWEARLHPLTRADRLKDVSVRALHQAIVKVLRRGVKNAGTTLGTSELNYYSVGKRRGRNRDQLRVFRRTGEPCPACAEPIIRILVGQRSTHLCPQCQPRRGT